MKKIMARTSPNLMKTYFQAPKFPSRANMKETAKMHVVIKLLEILQTVRGRSLRHAEQHTPNYSAILIRSCAIGVAGTPLKHQKGKTSAL